MTIIFTNNFYKENDTLLYNLEIYKSLHKKTKIFQNITDLKKFFKEIFNIYYFYIHLIEKINTYCKNKINRKKLLEFLKFIKDLDKINNIFYPNKNYFINNKLIIETYDVMFKYKKNSKLKIKNTTDQITQIYDSINDIEAKQTDYKDFLNKGNNLRKIKTFIGNDNLNLKQYRNDYQESIDLIYSSNKQNKNILFFCIYINLVNIHELLRIFQAFINQIEIP